MLMLVVMLFAPKPPTTTRAKRGPKPFVPTPDQRHVVGFLAGARMTWDELCLLVINPRTGKPISKDTLARAFPDELANGRSQLKKILLNQWLDVVKNGEGYDRWRAIEFGLRHINGWRDDAPSVQMNIGDEHPGMQIAFILPSGAKLDTLHDQHTRHDTNHAHYDDVDGGQAGG